MTTPDPSVLLAELMAAAPATWQHRYRYRELERKWSKWGPLDMSCSGMPQWEHETRALYAIDPAAIASAFAEQRARIEELEKALEPFGRADRAIGDEPGPFRFETLNDHRLIEREDLRRARKLLEPAHDL